ncbi:MAG: sugar transferase, partial [Sphaerochaetaceae bacterium]|nr:sugar transferase [Sphaerochaetaceae bacterium]
MLILGEKYKFTKHERQKLKKEKFKYKLIRYKDKDEKEILKEIQTQIEDKKVFTVVLNTKAKVDDCIIKYLTNIRFDNPKVKIITIEHFLEKYLFKCYIPDDHINLDYLDEIKPYSTFQYLQKRFIDYTGIFILLFLTWPILIYARKKIKKQSPGTSMFKQYRLGLDNKEFKCIKFRSMRLDAEKDGAKFATQNDPRVFPWGETMRKTRIDELPQMLNVLKGEMHFIGPRPERKIWTDKFEETIPYYSERHIVRPGITGWAQVMYPYGANAEDAKQKLMYDLYYIKYWNIWLETKVVFKTIMVILGR